MGSEGTPLESVPGVGPAAAMKLREHNILNAEYLARQSPVDLNATTKIGEATSAKIVRNARELLGYAAKNGLEVETLETSHGKFTTGLEKVDEGLFGGFLTGSLIEVYGPSRGGKSHLVAQLAVRAQLPREQGGLESRVLWLRTALSFRTLPIRAAASRYGRDGDLTLANIDVIEVINKEHLSDILKTLPAQINENGIRFIVIDNLGSLFQLEYTSLGERRYVERELVEVMETLRNIVKSTNGICLYTNPVFEAISSYGGNPNAPMNGHVMAHSSDYRFYLRRSMQERRKLAVHKAPDIPEFVVELEIGWGGFYQSKQERKYSEGRIKESLTTYFPPRVQFSERVEIIDEC